MPIVGGGKQILSVKQALVPAYRKVLLMCWSVFALLRPEPDQLGLWVILYSNPVPKLSSLRTCLKILDWEQHGDVEVLCSSN